METLSGTLTKDRISPSTAGLKAFFKIAVRWQLTRAQERILLGTSESSIHRWINEPAAAQLTPDQLERVSYILGIFDGLHRILGDTAFAEAWVNQPNRDFGDYAPLSRMLNGTVGDLAFVRNYVDRWADGW